MTDEQREQIIDTLAKELSYYADSDGDACPDVDCSKHGSCDIEDSDASAKCWKQCAINFVVNGTWRVDLEGCKR